MNRDEIIKMAQQATAPEWLDDLSTGWHMGLDLERFASLVAEAEREECAKVLNENAKLCVRNKLLREILEANAAAIRSRGAA